jgi:hypothetical protein
VLDAAEVEAAVFEAAIFETAELEDTELDLVELDTAELEDAELDAAELEDAELEAVELEAVELEAAELDVYFVMISTEDQRLQRVDGPCHRLGCLYTWNRSEIRHHTADPQEIRMAEVDLCIPPQDR